VLEIKIYKSQNQSTLLFTVFFESYIHIFLGPIEKRETEEKTGLHIEIITNLFNRHPLLRFFCIVVINHVFTVN